MNRHELGFADVGYRGSPIRTPNIDKLATEGVRMEPGSFSIGDAMEKLINSE